MGGQVWACNLSELSDVLCVMIVNVLRDGFGDVLCVGVGMYFVRVWGCIAPTGCGFIS